MSKSYVTNCENVSRPRSAPQTVRALRVAAVGRDAELVAFVVVERGGLARIGGVDLHVERGQADAVVDAPEWGRT